MTSSFILSITAVCLLVLMACGLVWDMLTSWYQDREVKKLTEKWKNKK